MPAVSVLTLGDMADAGMGLSAICSNPACRHWARLDLDLLIRECGRGYACSAYALVPLLKCGRCGSKKLRIQHQAATATHPQIMGTAQQPSPAERRARAERAKRWPMLYDQNGDAG